MKKDQFYIFVILALIVYIATRPKPDTAVNFGAPVPITQPITQATRPLSPNCPTAAEVEASKQQCLNQSKALAGELQERVDALERSVTDSFYAMADDWEKVGSRRPQERELIVKKIKADVLSVCGK
jgi:hypothetical protein